MASASLGSSSPSRLLTRAAASLTMPSARTRAGGMRSPPIWKFCSERWVWAPQ